MTEFFTALAGHAFLQHALIAGLLASVGCGIVGTYVVVRRISFLAGGIAHAVLSGMGIAYFLQQPPLGGALVAALVAALLIGWVSLRWKQQEDTLIAALWAVGMAVGILFISRTPGYNADLMSYLFGNILLVPARDLYMMGALDAAIVALVFLCYKQLLAVVFDEEFARVRGVNVEFYFLLLLTMVALTVVLLIKVVGLILVIALLTLPAAIAALVARSLAGIMALAVVLGALFTTSGLVLSYGPDLPSGATIILIAGGAYLAAVIGAGAVHRWRSRRPLSLEADRPK